GARADRRTCLARPAGTSAHPVRRHRRAPTPPATDRGHGPGGRHLCRQGSRAGLAAGRTRPPPSRATTVAARHTTVPTQPSRMGPLPRPTVPARHRPRRSGPGPGGQGHDAAGMGTTRQRPDQPSHAWRRRRLASHHRRVTSRPQTNRSRAAAIHRQPLATPPRPTSAATQERSARCRRQGGASFVPRTNPRQTRVWPIRPRPLESPRPCAL
ncbi:MAG: hypothetical protein AVDCRST_MAG75-2229, partial [uncultured Propionibacteriaceae bacterium]